MTMTPLQQAAKNAWDTYLKDWYVNNKGETKPTYAQRWRKSNPGNAAAILAYYNGTGPRPVIGDGYGPLIVNVVDINKLVQDPTPPPSSNPWDSGYAPQVYNKGSRGQDARYNIRINCVANVDQRGIHYDDAGLCLGGRTGNDVPGLKPVDMSDGLEPWQPYEWMGRTIGPNKEDYPAESYDQ